MECMSIWSVNLHGVWRHSTLHNIHMDTNMDVECIISHMECGEILTIICECGGTSWSVHPYGVSHCTLHNIHMDTKYGYGYRVYY